MAALEPTKRSPLCE